VEVEVVDTLAPIGSRVRHETVAARRKAQLSRDIASREDELSRHRFIGVVEVVDRPDVLPGNEQDVFRGAGVQIPEGEHVFTVPNDLRRELAPRNLAE
jgi:hypothetical protein